MNNRTILKMIAALIGLVGLIVLINVLHDILGIQVRQVYSVPSYFSSAVAYGRDSLVMSNNQVLEEYNYLTGATTVISPASGLANIDSLSVSANDRYFLFHQTVSVPSSQLSAILSKGNYNTSNPFGYWWLYDNDTKNFQVVPGNSLIVKFDPENRIDALQSMPGGEVIVTYDPSNMSQLKSISIIGSADFFPTSSGFLLQSPDDQIVYTSNGVVNEPVVSNTILVGVSAQKRIAVGVQDQNNVQQLIQINLFNDLTKVINNNVTNQPVWMAPDSVLYTTINSNSTSGIQELNSYDLSTGSNTQWGLNANSVKLSTEGIKPAAFIGQSTAVVSGSSSSYYLIGGRHLIKP